MDAYHNYHAIKKIGERITELRKSHQFEIEDISSMTGFTYNSIKAIENGGESKTSTLIEIAFAIGVQPTELFNIKFKIKTRFKLAANRKEKTRLKARIEELISTNYFATPKFAKDVLFLITKEHKIETTSSSISVTLLRFTDEGKLKFKKVGRQNQYFSK